MNVSKKVNVYESRGHLQIGELTITDEGHRRYSVFDYADEWVASENAFPICPEMELRGGPFSARVTFPATQSTKYFRMPPQTAGAESFLREHSHASSRSTTSFLMHHLKLASDPYPFLRIKSTMKLNSEALLYRTFRI